MDISIQYTEMTTTKTYRMDMFSDGNCISSCFLSKYAIIMIIMTPAIFSISIAIITFKIDQVVFKNKMIWIATISNMAEMAQINISSLQMRENDIVSIVISHPDMLSSLPVNNHMIPVEYSKT